MNTLDDHEIKASFFLTGNFLRNKTFKPVIKRIISGGHYLGPHSDGHLLYIPWENRDTLLVTKEQFNADLKRNLAELSKAGLKKHKPEYFLAPYEWYNSAISKWSAEMGFKLVNLTPGTGTNADYTTPAMKNYKSSDELLKRLKKLRDRFPLGLNGALVLIHPGTDPERTDKLYMRLGEIIEYFSKKGYTFSRL